jgi:hypothetical protein
MEVPWDPFQRMGAALPGIVVAAVFLLIGAVLVFWGWRLYRVALVLLGAALGALVGLCLAPELGVAAIFVALPLAIFCAILALVFQNAGVFLLGGLWGAYLVLKAPPMFETPAARYLVVALTFLVIGLLAVLLWRPMVTFLIAMCGAALIARAVEFGADQFKPGVAKEWAHQHPWIVFIALMIVAGIGLYFQEDGPGGEADG